MPTATIITKRLIAAFISIIVGVRDLVASRPYVNYDILGVVITIVVVIITIIIVF